MPSLLIETTLLVIISLTVYFFEPLSGDWLAYYHTGIKQFEFWRLITATFCHTNINHLAMNLLGLMVILGLFLDTFKKTSLMPLTIFSSVFIGLSLFILEPDVIWYVGFSGVLHSLFSYGVASELYQKSKWGVGLAIGLMGKIGYEQFFGAQQSTIDLIGAPVLVNAHLYGVIAGVIFYSVVLLKQKKNITIKAEKYGHD